MRNHDAILIGTGQSGSALARRLVAAGQKVAVIERWAAHGVTIGSPLRVDMQVVRVRKDRHRGGVAV